MISWILPMSLSFLGVSLFLVPRVPRYRYRGDWLRASTVCVLGGTLVAACGLGVASGTRDSATWLMSLLALVTGVLYTWALPLVSLYARLRHEPPWRERRFGALILRAVRGMWNELALDPLDRFGMTRQHRIAALLWVAAALRFPLVLGITAFLAVHLHTASPLSSGSASSALVVNILVHVAAGLSAALLLRSAVALIWGSYQLARDRSRVAAAMRAPSPPPGSGYARPEFAALTQLISTGTAHQEWFSLALVGPRGVGKSYLQGQIIAWAQEQDRRYLAFSIACPPDATGEALVLNAFERLCHAVLHRMGEDHGEQFPDLRDEPRLPRAPLPVSHEFVQLFKIAVGVAFAVYSSGVVWGFSSGVHPLLLRLLPVTAAGVLALFGPTLGIAYLLRHNFMAIETRMAMELGTPESDERQGGGQLPTRQAGTQRPFILRPEHTAQPAQSGPQMGLLYARTCHCLEFLEHEQKETRRREDEISAVSLLTHTFSLEREAAKRPLTLPGLVDAYRDYVTRFVVPAYDRVVVVIDELDRISEPDQVMAFLRRFKSALMIPGLIHVMSVAEDVVKSVQLHSFAKKDEADSAFCEVIQLDPLSVQQVLDFMASEAPHTDSQAACAIAALSGGVLREVARLTRRFECASAQHQEGDDTSALAAFLEGEIAEAVSQFRTHLRTSAAPPATKAKLGEILRRQRAVTDLSQTIVALRRYAACDGDWSHLPPKAFVRKAHAGDVLELILHLEVLRRLYSESDISPNAYEETCNALREVVEVASNSPVEAAWLLGLQ